MDGKVYYAAESNVAVSAAHGIQQHMQDNANFSEFRGNSDDMKLLNIEPPVKLRNSDEHNYRLVIVFYNALVLILLILLLILAMTVHLLIKADQGDNQIKISSKLSMEEVSESTASVATEYQATTDQSDLPTEQPGFSTEQLGWVTMKYVNNQLLPAATYWCEKGIDLVHKIGCGVFNQKRSCYHMTLQSGDFDALTKFCEERNMQMLVLETWEEYKFIADYIQKTKLSWSFKISLKRVNGSFYWFYPNGTTSVLDYGNPAFNPWAPGEPKPGDSLNCGSSCCGYFWSAHPGKWDDFLCSRIHQTICEFTD